MIVGEAQVYTGKVVMVLDPSLFAEENGIHLLVAGVEHYLHVAEVLLSLEPLERRQRFCGTLGEESVRAHARMAVARNVVVLAMCGQMPVGASELALTQDPEALDLAFAVREGWRGQGIGSRLVQIGIKESEALGYKMITAHSLTGNRAPRLIFLKFGFNYDVNDGEYSWSLKIR